MITRATVGLLEGLNEFNRLAENHVLMQEYGWTPADIEALSLADRLAYLGIIDGIKRAIKGKNNGN